MLNSWASVALLQVLNFMGRREVKRAWDERGWGCAPLFNITLECISMNLHFRLAKCTGGSKIFSRSSQRQPAGEHPQNSSTSQMQGQKILVLPSARTRWMDLQQKDCHHLIFKPRRVEMFAKLLAENLKSTRALLGTKRQLILNKNTRFKFRKKQTIANFASDGCKFASHPI